MRVWTAFSRGTGKIVAYVIGNERDCAYELYCKTKRAVGKITCIYTDANSCYAESFAAHGVKEPHIIARGKSQTHLIESTNSSIRDNLARFNRKSKRYSKSIEMLDCFLKIFFDLKTYNST